MATLALAAAASLGLTTGTKEVLKYNRDNFKFDQEQRIKRQTWQVKMQIARFSLFREDVRDLMALTVDRMDVYHFVGEVLMSCCIKLMVQGRTEEPPPPFVLSLYLLSAANAFIFFVLAVWLSMHASISAHSFGVRLLTRFVRLPIPSREQVNKMTYHLSDWEQAGATNLLRLPFLDRRGQQSSIAQKLKNSVLGNERLLAPPTSSKRLLAPPRNPTRSTRSRSPISNKPQIFHPARAASAETPVRRVNFPASRSVSPVNRSLDTSVAHPLQPATTALPAKGQVGGFFSAAGLLEQEKQKLKDDLSRDAQGGSNSEQEEEDVVGDLPNFLPQAKQKAFDEGLMNNSMGSTPERHVKLFRQLQFKWQCYDAYCRVCIGLGATHLLQGMCYYAVSRFQIEGTAHFVAFVLLFLFQSAAVALGVMDLANLELREIIVIQTVSVIPCCTTAFLLFLNPQEGPSSGSWEYPGVWFIFFLQAYNLELWLRVASPASNANHAMPRKFRQILFLDVFGDSQDRVHPTDDFLTKWLTEEAANVEDKEAVGDSLAELSNFSSQAQGAVRRWRAVPGWMLNKCQHTELERIGDALGRFSNFLHSQFSLMEEAGFDIHEAKQNAEFPLRAWTELSHREQTSEPYSCHLLGPLTEEGPYEDSTFYWKLEDVARVYEDDKTPDMPVLTLDGVAKLVENLEAEEKQFIEACTLHDIRVVDRFFAPTCNAHMRRALPEHVRKEMEEEDIVPPSGGWKLAENVFGPNLVRLTREKWRLRHERRIRDGQQQELGKALLSFNQRSKVSEDNRKAKKQQPVSIEMTACQPGNEARWESNFGKSSDDHPPLEPASPPKSVKPNSPQFARKHPSTDPQKIAGDPTLRAMAGKHAKQFAPESLPWTILRRLTTVLQIAWVVVGCSLFLKDFHLNPFDVQRKRREFLKPAPPPPDERRLSSAISRSTAQPDLLAEIADGFNILGHAFDPSGLFCTSAEGNDIWLSSRFYLHWFSRGRSTEWTETLKVRDPKRHLAIVCADVNSHLGSRRRSCMSIVPGEGSLEFARLDEADYGKPDVVRLGLEGPSWKRVAGETTACSDVELLLTRPALSNELTCLLLIGWTGRALVTAALPIKNFNDLPSESDTVIPMLDLPLSDFIVDRSLVSFNVDSNECQLWLLLEGGMLELWDPVLGKRLGSWSQPWKLTPADFYPRALCGGSAVDGLLVVGQRLSAGVTMLKATFPHAML